MQVGLNECRGRLDIHIGGGRNCQSFCPSSCLDSLKKRTWEGKYRAALWGIYTFFSHQKGARFSGLDFEWWRMVSLSVLRTQAARQKKRNDGTIDWLSSLPYAYTWLFFCTLSLFNRNKTAIRKSLTSNLVVSSLWFVWRFVWLRVWDQWTKNCGAPAVKVWERPNKLEELVQAAKVKGPRDWDKAAMRDKDALELTNKEKKAKGWLILTSQGAWKGRNKKETGYQQNWWPFYLLLPCLLYWIERHPIHPLWGSRAVVVSSPL